ncbi:MAG: four helix bundle protein [Gemmatimonadaceae bacterium]
MEDHRRLHVWARAHGLAIDVRRVTRRMPRTGYGSLQSQMTRAAESVLFNIVEGCGCRSKQEFARFIDISIKSTSELECQLELAKDYGAMADREYRALAAEVVELRRMLCVFRAKILLSAASRAKVSN